MDEKRYFYITPEDYEIAEKNGIKRATVYQRVNDSGWDIDRAITQPPASHKTGNWTKWKDRSVVCYNTFAGRIRAGMTPEQAALTPIIPHAKRRKAPSVFSDEQIEIARKNGISKSIASQRYHACGWSIEDAITIPVMDKSQAAYLSVEKRRENKKLKAMGG